MGSKDGVMHELNPKKKSANSTLIIVIVFALALGVASAFLATRIFGGASISTLSSGGTAVEKIEKGETVGSDDLETFKDTAEGTVREGGLDGEGAFHLERPGGEDQYVYLSSSTVNLSQFVGKKVKIWGQTNNSNTAGWLMEVGRLQLLE